MVGFPCEQFEMIYEGLHCTVPHVSKGPICDFKMKQGQKSSILVLPAFIVQLLYRTEFEKSLTAGRNPVIVVL